MKKLYALALALLLTSCGEKPEFSSKAPLKKMSLPTLKAPTELTGGLDKDLTEIFIADKSHALGLSHTLWRSVFSFGKILPSKFELKHLDVQTDPIAIGHYWLETGP